MAKFAWLSLNPGFHHLSKSEALETCCHILDAEEYLKLSDRFLEESLILSQKNESLTVGISS